MSGPREGTIPELEAKMQELRDKLLLCEKGLEQQRVAPGRLWYANCHDLLDGRLSVDTLLERTILRKPVYGVRGTAVLQKLAEKGRLDLSHEQIVLDHMPHRPRFHEAARRNLDYVLRRQPQRQTVMEVGV